MNEKLNDYFENKGINNPFVRKIITKYLSDHIRCFGENITEDMIIERLYENLNAVKIIRCETSDYHLNNKQVASRYNGFDGIISLYVVTDMIKDSTYKEYIRDTMYHSLTHAVYFIKDGARDNISQEMFGTIERNDINRNVITFKNDEFIEAITNFISTTMTGRENGKYEYETRMMNKLAKVLNIDEIIKSTWASDKELFEKALEPLNKENAYKSLGYCFKLCKYNMQFLDVAAYRFNDLIGNTDIPKMPIISEPSKAMSIIAAYKVNDIAYAEKAMKGLSIQNRLALKVEIEETTLLGQREKELLFDSIIREK